MDLDARKQAVKDFLQRCVEYADASIARKRERAEGGEGDESETEISRWRLAIDSAVALVRRGGGFLRDARLTGFRFAAFRFTGFRFAAFFRFATLAFRPAMRASV